MRTVLEVKHLSVMYSSLPVLWDISVQLPRGHLIGVIGPNGAGKTTFLKALCGLVKYSAGAVLVAGGDRERIAYVPQRSDIDWNFPMTAFELIEMGLWNKKSKMSRKEKAAAVDEMLHLMGMQAYRDRQIGELSGGQQQRLFIGRALLQDADVFLLDEVFNGIDILTEEFLLELFKKMRSEGKTVIIVHHDLTSVERDFDWIVMLNVRLVAAGPTKKVFTKDLLAKTYGKSPAFLEEVVRLSEREEG